MFVTVTRWAALVVPTRWLPKSCEFIDDVEGPPGSSLRTVAPELNIATDVAGALPM